MNPNNENALLQMVLEKPSEMRSTEDVDSIFTWLMQLGNKLKIFQGVQDIIIRTICRELTMLSLLENELVCQQGEYGDTFYIIISGSVSLFVLDAKTKAQRESEEVKVASETPTVLIPSNYGKLIKRLRAGDTFGELAILDPTAKRSCTVITDRPTSFIALKRAAYQRLVRGVNKHETTLSSIEFLKTLYIFSNWTQSDLTRLAFKMRQVSMPKNSYLGKRGSDCNSIYFIVSGRVQETIPMMCFYENYGTKMKYIPLNESHKELSELVTKRSNQKWRISYLELALLESRDVCCEYPIVQNKLVHQIDTMAVTNVELLALDRATWVEIFRNDRQDSVLEALNHFKEVASSREHWRRTRINMAVTHPGMTFTLSTSNMMKLANPICGWCGRTTHVTGDPVCEVLVQSSQKKKAEEEKKKQQMEVTTINETISQAEEYPHVFKADIMKEQKRRVLFKMKMLVKTLNLTREKPTNGSEQIGRHWELVKLRQHFRNGAVDQVHTTEQEEASQRDNYATPELLGDGFKNTTEEKRPSPSPPALSEALHHTRITHGEFRQEMLKEIKSIASVDDYKKSKTRIIERFEMERGMGKVQNEKLKPHPPVPKSVIRRRTRVGHQYNRKINRLLRNIWPADQTIQVEESLKD